jgi:adenine/guanine phosphoribosyltransferase-like PRPP-binding protein
VGGSAFDPHSTVTAGYVSREPQLIPALVQLVRAPLVIILDDVVSSGATENVLQKFIEHAGGTHVGTAAVFTEGTPPADVISLGLLPLPAVPI